MIRATFALLFLCIAAPASAREPIPSCATSSDCPSGYTCESQTYDQCPPCREGEECGDCTSETYSYCSPPPPAPCNADSDCSNDQVCVSYTYGTCSGVACSSEDPNCEQTEPTCTETTEAYCVPRYFAPCQIDADCGSGFTCETSEICSCSGSTGSSEEGEPTDFSEDCSCEPTGEKYCNLIPVVCDTDNDCASGLVCLELGDVVVSDGGDSTDPTTPDGDTEPVDPTFPPESESYCAPADIGYWGAGSADKESSAQIGDYDAAERISWAQNDDGSASGDKAEPGCATPGGGLSLLALFGLPPLRRRRS